MAKKLASDGAVKQVRFHNPRLARVGVELMTLRELRERTGATLGAPERVDFLLLLLVEAGRGRHMVDFVECALRPGTLLVVRPGQVHQWRMTAALQGQLLLVMPEALAPGIGQAQPDMKLLALEDWPAASQTAPALLRLALQQCARLRTDIAAFGDRPIESAVIRHELMALLLRLASERTAREPMAEPAREVLIHRLFVQELERHFHERLSVLDYARSIGYSESTLSRACLAAAGHTAKHVIDLRVALEAKRLLVHSGASVVQIGHQLGFSEPTNFVKFFKRLAGATPSEFRSRAAP
jgi:AraC-like DNA-binding protein